MASFPQLTTMGVQVGFRSRNGNNAARTASTQAITEPDLRHDVRPVADYARVSASSLEGFSLAQISRFCEARLLPSAGYLGLPFWFAAIVGSRQVPVMAESLCTFPFRWSWARWSPSNPGAGL